MDYSIDIKETTPVEKHGSLYIKRDDTFEIFGARGGKARAAYQLILQGLAKGYTEFVTAGSRMSPQCEIISTICQHLGYKCHLFMSSGPSTSVIENISRNDLSKIHFTFPRYNTVICCRAKEYAKANDACCYIPFGMECAENIEITKHQVQNIPDEVSHITMPIGSGMSFVSVLNGLEYYGKHNISVTGVAVGKDPMKAIMRYINAPNIKFNIVHSELSYDKQVEAEIDGVVLDPIYEAKVLPYVQDNDLIWIVGIRKLNCKLNVKNC